MRNSAEGDARAQALRGVAAQLRLVLQELDSLDAPKDIGAHIDRALCRLEDICAGKPG